MYCGAGEGAVVSVSANPYVNAEEEPERGPDILMDLSAVQGVHECARLVVYVLMHITVHIWASAMWAEW